MLSNQSRPSSRRVFLAAALSAIGGASFRQRMIRAADPVENRWRKSAANPIRS
jgi:hypothetical protein